MKPNSNLRPIYILRYLYENTDEEHPASTADIVAYLEENGIPTHRQTVAAETEQLSELGADIIAIRSRQNQYFIGNRTFELAELKLMADAIQAAKFITPGKSEHLLRKLSKFASNYHAAELNRSLYRDDRIKATNESIIYTVNLLHTAIQTEKIVCFKYYDYTPEKKKVFRHHGQMYELSPYDLAWCDDKYYVFGYSKSHEKTVKFRVDRICQPQLSETNSYVPKPEDYDLSAFFKRTFSVFDDETCVVELLCDTSCMNAIIDRFGEDVKTKADDGTHFIAEVEVSVSPTFFAWVFTYAGQIRILSPEKVIRQYRQQLDTARQ